jgi:uncharacterized protein (DUF362 family)
MTAIQSEKSTVFLRDLRGRDTAEVVEELMQACGWEDLVPSDATVVVKPNLCMSVPDKVLGSNTHVEVTEAVCRLLQRRTRKIYVAEADHLRQTAWEAFEVSGYTRMAREVGVELVDLTEMPSSRIRCDPVEVGLPRLLLDADVLITLPVLKTHALTYFTGALKNQWGCVPQYDRILLHRHLDEMLGSLHALLKPRLCLMDAIVAMEGRGPTNGKPRRMDLLLASRDAVALDAAAMRLVGLEPPRARHVVLAAERGLGKAQPAEIELDGDWAAHAAQFEPAILDRAIAAMNYMSRYKWFVRFALEQDYVFYPVRAMVRLLRRVGVVEGGH